MTRYGIHLPKENVSSYFVCYNCVNIQQLLHSVSSRLFWRDICSFLIEKVFKLTPKLSKIFPIFDTSGETLCNNTKNTQGPVKFSKLAKDLLSSNFYFLSTKFHPRNTPETRTPLFPQTGITKNPFLIFFSLESYDGETLFPIRDQLRKQWGTLRPNESIGKTHIAEKLKWFFHNQSETSSVLHDQK